MKGRGRHKAWVLLLGTADDAKRRVECSPPETRAETDECKLDSSSPTPIHVSSS